MKLAWDKQDYVWAGHHAADIAKIGTHDLDPPILHINNEKDQDLAKALANLLQ